MKKLLIFSLLFTSLFLFGCGGDDDGDGPVDPPATLQITAATAATAPTTVDDAVWGTIAAKAVPTTSINFSKLTPTSPAAVANSVSVKAAVHSDRLYMRFEWADATQSVWRESYRVTGRDAVQDWIELLHNSTLTHDEDRLMVMFQNAAQGSWDTWQWRALTTDGAGLAEGAKITGSTYTEDATGLAGGTDVATPNENGSQPMYIHNTLDQFTGHLLLEDETVVFVAATHSPLSGWEVDQQIPGYVIDASVAQNSQRGSKWDITAASDYTGGVWSVVLSCDLNTTSTDDLDLSSLSQVNIRVAVTNNEAFSYSTGSTNQGFSASVPLILP